MGCLVLMASNSSGDRSCSRQLSDGSSGPASRSNTVAPPSVRHLAAVPPAAPEPTTMASYSICLQSIGAWPFSSDFPLKFSETPQHTSGRPSDQFVRQFFIPPSDYIPPSAPVDPVLVPLDSIAYGPDQVLTTYFREVFDALFEETHVALINKPHCVNHFRRDLNMRERECLIQFVQRSQMDHGAEAFTAMAAVDGFRDPFVLPTAL